MRANDDNASDDPKHGAGSPAVPDHGDDGGPVYGLERAEAEVGTSSGASERLCEEDAQLGNPNTFDANTRRILDVVKRLEQLPLTAVLPSPLLKGQRSTLRIDAFRWLAALNAASRSKAWADNGVACRRKLKEARIGGVAQLTKLGANIASIVAMGEERFAQLLLCAMSHQIKRKYGPQAVKGTKLPAVLSQDAKCAYLDDHALIEESLKPAQGCTIDDQCRVLAEVAVSALELTHDLPPIELPVKCLWVLLRLRLIGGRRPNNLSSAFRRVAAEAAIAAGLECSVDAAVHALYATLWRCIGHDPSVGAESELSVFLKSSGASVTLASNQAGRRGRSASEPVQLSRASTTNPFQMRPAGSVATEPQLDRVKRLLHHPEGFAMLCSKSFLRSYLDASELKVSASAKPAKWSSLFFTPTRQWLSSLLSELEASSPMRMTISNIIRGFEFSRFSAHHDSGKWWFDVDDQRVKLPGPFHLGNVKANVDYIELTQIFGSNANDRALEIIRCAELGKSLADIISSAPSTMKSAAFNKWRKYLVEQEIAPRVKASLTMSLSLEPSPNNDFAAALFDPTMDALVAALS